MVKRAVAINPIHSKMFELKCRLSKEKQTLIGRCKNAQLLFAILYMLSLKDLYRWNWTYASLYHGPMNGPGQASTHWTLILDEWTWLHTRLIWNFSCWHDASDVSVIIRMQYASLKIFHGKFPGYWSTNEKQYSTTTLLVQGCWIKYSSTGSMQSDFEESRMYTIWDSW
jgi:hypothetical protein